MPRAKITGTGMYVPPRVVTNDDLAKLMDTSDEWIRQRTGIEERHHIDDGMTASDLAYEASTRALQAAGVEVGDIDMILVPTLSPQHYFPGTAAFLQEKLGCDRTPALGLRAQCTGFIYGLQMAQALIESGIHKRVLLCGVEVHSRYVEYNDRGRNVAVLFGDGAGALVLEASDDDSGILSTHVHAQGKHAKRLWIEYPATHRAATDSILVDGVPPLDSDETARMYPQMDGKYVFKNAVRRMPEVVMEALAANNMIGTDIDFFLFHQANLRINEFVARMMEIPEEKRYDNIQKYGNCSAASIPMLMDECVREGRIKKGDVVAMAGFGSGFTWGGALIRM